MISPYSALKIWISAFWPSFTFPMENGRGVSDRSYGLQVENAAYELEKKQEELEKTEIKSEIDGTVVRVNSKVGQFAV